MKDSPIIIDSHVHLWPGSRIAQDSHTWMTPGHPLARQYSIQDYHHASSSYPVHGFIYVETDRARGPQDSHDVQEWASGGLDEVAFLRRIVEGTPDGADGFTPGQGDQMVGAVIWAPLDRSLEDTRAYLQAVRETGGEKTWQRIKGFRYLLQGIKDAADFEGLVRSDRCIQTLRELGKFWTFDVAVDQRQGGVWQMEQAADMIAEVHRGIIDEEKVTFILNHLCKPDMQQEATTGGGESDFDRWKRCMQRLATSDKVYLKLSGAFSEMGQQDAATPTPVRDVVRRMKPWLEAVFQCFGPERIMYGSDWPVCNVVGPGAEKSWRHWQNVVSAIMDEFGCEQEQRNRIWSGTAIEAYRLKL